VILPHPLRSWLVTWAVFALFAGATPASAQVCTGDCNGDTAVTIGELIRAVNIALGLVPLEDCAAIDVNDNREADIAELIQAVGRALLNCPPTPTQVLTATASMTPTLTPTPTTTSTPTEVATSTPSHTPPETTSSPTTTIVFPDVSGTWREEPLQLVSSTCLEIIALAFADELAQRPPCDHQVSSFQDRVTVVDCAERAVVGNVDARGIITYALPDQTGLIENCVVTLGADVIVPAGLSPTTATYIFEIEFGGTCPLPSCSLTADGTWTLLAK
jgi:hypothetical protein